MIKAEDFEPAYVEDHPVPYLKWNDGEVQICLEPCTAGMCVGIYDADDWILAEKKCTNFRGTVNKEKILVRAVELANELYQEWRSKNVVE